MARKKANHSTRMGIKKRLAELQLDQREFCRLHNIPENRLGDIITGTRKAVKHREKIQQLLGIGNYPEKKQSNLSK
ncbi:XRE family transcriptional regulator [Paenibacillus melissococcoides]|uniref:XRE family transcriptional regulator n=1 Tax=Paenibacillus melissococcoides TaxID=2912268 RepID=UPI0021C2E5ED|nr:XRE family transcriptional regulator [Paenibacillus melissococcoides]CAH8719590.1 XRE family transcriptional regulator [Paenibacillus melissococcoides]